MSNPKCCNLGNLLVIGDGSCCCTLYFVCGGSCRRDCCSSSVEAMWCLIVLGVRMAASAVGVCGS